MDEDRSTGYSRTTLGLVDCETKRKCPNSLSVQIELEGARIRKEQEDSRIVTNSVLGAKSIKDENIKLPEDDGGP